MRNRLKTFLVPLTFAALLAGSARLSAQVTVGVNPAASWNGFMNVFETPQHGGGYVFGSGWGTADLVATFSGSVLTLSPNTINDPSSFWYTPSGGPGAVGNKTMDANFYVENSGSLYAGQTLTFTGNVLANTLVGHVNQIGNGWTSVAFIKDFTSDYSSNVSTTAPLVNGVFSISQAITDPTHHIQYGFETIGPDVWSTDVGPYGNIQIGPVPEPSTLGLLALGAVGLMCSRRSRK